jgi:hypothetical protein
LKVLYWVVVRYPLHISDMRRILAYWLNLLEMHDSRYPKQCYYMETIIKDNTCNTLRHKVHHQQHNQTNEIRMHSISTGLSLEMCIVY